jgi:hypothetical protein
MRVVIDTNIWVSGLLWRGSAWRLLQLAEQGEIELCITHSMLLELGTYREIPIAALDAFLALEFGG